MAPEVLGCVCGCAPRPGCFSSLCLGAHGRMRHPPVCSPAHNRPRVASQPRTSASHRELNSREVCTPDPIFTHPNAAPASWHSRACRMAWEAERTPSTQPLSTSPLALNFFLVSAFSGLLGFVFPLALSQCRCENRQSAGTDKSILLQEWISALLFLSDVQGD